MKKIKSLIINLDFCGFCNGSCVGCLLTEEERKTEEAFLDFKKSKESLNKLKDKYSDNYVEKLVIAFGRGNTITLNEKDWQEIKKVTEYLREVIEHRECVIECSTGLVGKIESHIVLAKKWVDFMQPHNLRFVIVANASLFSTKYWENLDIFFKELGTYRLNVLNEKIDNVDDILNINLHSNDLPDVNFLFNKIKEYNFPINLTLLPLYRTVLSNNKTLEFEYNLDTNTIYENLEDWLEKFFMLTYSYKNIMPENFKVEKDEIEILKLGDNSTELILNEQINTINLDQFEENDNYLTKGMDVNFVKIIKMDFINILVNHNHLTLLDAIDSANQNSESFYWIQKNGELTQGLFSILGDMDFERLLEKLELKTEEEQQVIKVFPKPTVSTISIEDEQTLSTQVPITHLVALGTKSNSISTLLFTNAKEIYNNKEIEYKKINITDLIKNFRKIFACKNCPYQNMCIKNSSFIYSILNDHILPSLNNCPNGLKKVYTLVEEKCKEEYKNEIEKNKYFK